MPLGSIQELPAESCSEIKVSEGNEMANGDYWIYSDGNRQTILARCEGTVIWFVDKVVQNSSNSRKINEWVDQSISQSILGVTSTFIKQSQELSADLLSQWISVRLRDL